MSLSVIDQETLDSQAVLWDIVTRRAEREDVSIFGSDPVSRDLRTILRSLLTTADDITRHLV